MDADESAQSTSDTESSLRKGWGDFFRIVLDPWAVVLFLSALGLAVAAVNQTEARAAAPTTFMLSVVTGVLGARYLRRWTELSQEQVLTARGKTAVRSLQLLLGHISRIEGRVRRYLTRFQEDVEGETISDEVVRTYLEEVVEQCGHLQEQALSAIENWTDIVPEADIKTQIGVITELREELDQRKDELEELEEQLEDQEETREEAERLRSEIERKQQEVSRLKRRIAEESFTGTIAASTGTARLESGWVTDEMVGELAEPKMVITTGGASLTRCDQCGSIMYGTEDGGVCASCGGDVSA